MRRNPPKVILDTETGTEYPSMGAAGRELAYLIDGDPADRFVWYAIVRAFPGRFRTPDSNGQWVLLPYDKASTTHGQWTDRRGDTRLREVEQPPSKSATQSSDSGRKIEELADEVTQQEGVGSAGRSIEDIAVDLVVEAELRAGRSAHDIRGRGRGDVQSEGRLIEVKAFSGWGLRSTGLLLFTPPQIREGTGNPDYYVYIVENLRQGDPSRVELRALHGDDLRRLFAEAKIQRVYVPVRKADYDRLERIR